MAAALAILLGLGGVYAGLFFETTSYFAKKAAPATLEAGARTKAPVVVGDTGNSQQLAYALVSLAVAFVVSTGIALRSKSA